MYFKVCDAAVIQTVKPSAFAVRLVSSRKLACLKQRANVFFGACGEGSRSRCLRGEGLLRRHRICRRCNLCSVPAYHFIICSSILRIQLSMCVCATGAGRATGPGDVRRDPLSRIPGSQKTYARSDFDVVRALIRPGAASAGRCLYLIIRRPS